MARGAITHCIAVHQEDSKGLAAVVLQAEEKGVMPIEVVSSLEVRRGGSKSESEPALPLVTVCGRNDLLLK